jgi:bacillithiol system protein YtxJ
MLKWFSGSESKQDLPVFDQKRVAELDLAVVFKHSTTCPVSFSAERQMNAFMRSHPEVPVYKVLVREQRTTSNQIADWTGVEHESPQVIVLRKGAVVASASHGEVTEDNIDELIKG